MDSSKDCWHGIRKINPIRKLTSDIIEDAKGSKEVGNLFYHKYNQLYNSLPTDNNEVCNIFSKFSDKLSLQEIDKPRSTPDVIELCIIKLKSWKGDWAYEFKSDHLIKVV